MAIKKDIKLTYDLVFRTMIARLIKINRRKPWIKNIRIKKGTKMKMKKMMTVLTISLALLTITGITISHARAADSIKMFCALEVKYAGQGPDETPVRLGDLIYTTDIPLAEGFDKLPGILDQYKDYKDLGFVISNTSKGTIVVIINKAKIVKSALIPSGQREFKVEIKLKDLSSTKVTVDCSTP